MENKNRKTIVYIEGKEVDCSKMFCGSIKFGHNKILEDGKEFDCSKMFCGGVMINKLIDIKGNLKNY